MNVFYLVIDRQSGTENVYFLNAVTEADLLALAEMPEESVTPAPAPTPEPTPEPETKSNAGTLLLVAAVVLIGGGVAWYFKIYRPKQQRAAEPEEDYGDESDYDDGPPWDEEDAGEPEE